MENYFLDTDRILRKLIDRDPYSHKGNYGKILLLCGSRGYTGAASLAALGALRTGAGLVYLGVPESIYPIVACKLTESIVFPLPDEKGAYSCHMEEDLIQAIGGKDALLIGPGIGRTEGAIRTVISVLEKFSGPVVLDADGIYAIARHKDILRSRTGVTILTPHEGEFRRLGGDPYGGRARAAAELAQDLHALVLLKGHCTVVTDGNSCYENHTGNPGMAVGGSGDLLAGMITSFLGQGLSPMDAAAFGAWLHGRAGDLCAEEMGQCAMLPTDMLRVLPRLLR